MSIDVARLHDLEQRIEKTDDGEMISLPVGFVRELAAAAAAQAKFQDRVAAVAGVGGEEWIGGEKWEAP